MKKWIQKLLIIVGSAAVIGIVLPLIGLACSDNSNNDNPDDNKGDEDATSGNDNTTTSSVGLFNPSGSITFYDSTSSINTITFEEMAVRLPTNANGDSVLKPTISEDGSIYTFTNAIFSANSFKATLENLGTDIVINNNTYTNSNTTVSFEVNEGTYSNLVISFEYDNVTFTMTLASGFSYNNQTYEITINSGYFAPTALSDYTFGVGSETINLDLSTSSGIVFSLKDSDNNVDWTSVNADSGITLSLTAGAIYDYTNASFTLTDSLQLGLAFSTSSSLSGGTGNVISDFSVATAGEVSISWDGTTSTISTTREFNATYTSSNGTFTIPNNSANQADNSITWYSSDTPSSWTLVADSTYLAQEGKYVVILTGVGSGGSDTVFNFDVDNLVTELDSVTINANS